jgi:hypothetical protein
MDFFYIISRHFWMEFPCPRDFQKNNPQPKSAPHEFHHDISVPSPDGQNFIPTALFQQTKMKGDLATNLISRCLLHSLLLTKFAVTGHYQVHPGISKKNISTLQSTWMEMEDGCSAAVALEDCGGAAALRGGVGRWFKIAAAALGGGNR